MPQLFRNNAFSALGASLTDVATTLTVTTGQGDRFPAVTAPDFFMLTLQNASNNIEIVRVTARTAGADSMTIQRAQEGTTARAWNIDDVVELRLTAFALNPLSLLEGSATAAAVRAILDVPTRAGGDASGTWGISISGNAGTATTTTGNAGTATTLQTARNINGISFNGSADITLPTVNTAGDQTIAGTKTFNSSPVVPGLNGGQLAGMRNKIINGKMEIAQRGTSFAAIANAAYGLDRWQFLNVGSSSVSTLSQAADFPSTNEFRVSQRVTITTADAAIAAGDVVALQQKIEGYEARDLIGRAFTLSFWVRSSKTGIHCVAFRNSGADRSYVAEYTVNAANTWEQKSVTVSGGLITAGTWNWTTGVGLSLGFSMACGTTYQTTAGAWNTGDFYATANQVNCLDTIDNIFAITGVQLEVGSVATPFEHRPYGVELALCQRYYTVLGTFYVSGYATDVSSQFPGFTTLPNKMRTAPTANAGTSDNTRVESITHVLTADNYQVSITPNSTPNWWRIRIDDVRLSAEL